jgi:NitT/TauT family transport system substrate-binding protein
MIKGFIRRKLRQMVLISVCIAVACSFAAGCASGSGQTSTTTAEPAQTAQQAQSPTVQSAQPMQTAQTALPVKVNVAAIKGPSAIGMVKLMDDSESAAGLVNEYNFEITPAIDEVTAMLVQGRSDISAVPANLASVLYNNKDIDIKVIAVPTLGVLYIVENGDSVHSVGDLRGKTIFLYGKGATPEYAVNYILKQNGIDPEKDVTLEFKSEHTECLTLLAQNKNAVAMLPQPFVTTAIMKDESIRVAIDLNAEWEALQTGGNKSALITTAVIARQQFIDEHPDAVSEFLREYGKSVSWVNTNIDDASKLIEKYEIVPAQVAKRALPYCNIVFIYGAEMVEKLGGYLKILFEQNPKSIGGAIPDEDFYYISPF